MRFEQLDGRATPARASTVTGVELDGEAVLYESVTESIHQLNITATLVWNCLDGCLRLEDLADGIAAAVDAEPEAVRHDVVAVVRQFAAQGLLEGVSAAEEAAR